MIKLQQVSKVYNGTAAVNNISFDVNEGENMVLLGTSGCGKTTTLRMINRLTKPSSGKILVNGKYVGKQSPEKLRQGIGYVLQHNGLFPHYTVGENVGVVPALLHWNKKKMEQRTHELLEKLHLPPGQYANLYPNELSGGQQQRVGLARALAADPPILLMDEPFGALDPVTRTSIRKEFSELEEFKIKTIVLVTHDVQEAFELGDRICLMDKGRIVQMGTPAELLFKPVNDFVNSFFQGNRLPLELQAITIGDVFEQLNSTLDSEPAVEISLQTSIWNALDSLSRNQGSKPEVKMYAVNQGLKKQVDMALLMGAYSSFKTRRHE